MTSYVILFTIILLLTMLSIYTVLIMFIWNNVLVQKVRGANLQRINFWEALSISIFFSLISGSTIMYRSPN